MVLYTVEQACLKQCLFILLFKIKMDKGNGSLAPYLSDSCRSIRNLEEFNGCQSHIKDGKSLDFLWQKDDDYGVLEQKLNRRNLY